IDHIIFSLVRALLERNRDDAWPIFEAAISAANPHEGFYLEHVLGKGFDRFEEGQAGPIFKLGDDFLLDWCRRKPNAAPAFVAKTMPLLVIDRNSGNSSWTPLAAAIFEEFGDREDVLSAISANMGTFGWVGSVVPYYERFIGPLELLTAHK